MENLIPNGTSVRFLHNNNLTGYTDGVCIRGTKNDSIEYLVIIWMGSERKEQWVRDREIEIIPKKEPMGFKPDPTIFNNNLLKQ